MNQTDDMYRAMARRNGNRQDSLDTIIVEGRAQLPYYKELVEERAREKSSTFEFRWRELCNQVRNLIHIHFPFELTVPKALIYTRPPSDREFFILQCAEALPIQVRVHLKHVLTPDDFLVRLKAVNVEYYQIMDTDVPDMIMHDEDLDTTLSYIPTLPLALALARKHYLLQQVNTSSEHIIDGR